MRCVVGFVLTCLFLAPGAQAAANKFEFIFTASNHGRLCATNAKGMLVVNREELAHVIVEQVGVPLKLLYRANPLGTPQTFINGNSVKYAVSTPMPFGPGPYDEDTGKYAKTLNEYRTDFGAFPPDNAKAAGFQFPNTSSEMLPATTYFRDGTPDIQCTPKKPASGGASGGAATGDKAKSDLAKNVLVRKTVADLGTDLKKAAFATLSYEQKKVGQRGISADIVVGYKLTEFDLPVENVGRLAVIPYLRYSASHTNAANDKEVFEPGILLDTYVSTEWINFTLNATGAVTLDREHDARKEDFALSVYPTFLLGPAGPFLGGPLPPIGPLALIPDVQLKVAGSHIADAGTNTEFQKASSYTSYGIEPRVHFGFYPDSLPPYASFLSGLQGTVTYTLLNNSNGVRDVRYFMAQVAYTLPQSDNWSLTLDRKKGEDPSTLEVQNYWKLGLGYRY